MSPLLAVLLGLGPANSPASGVQPGDLTQSAPNSAPAPSADDGPPVAITGTRPVDHKGMFGLHGTARNILGVLGDAFLAQAHQPAVYGPKRDQEKLSDAARGLFADVDPTGVFGRMTKESLPDALDAYTKIDSAGRLRRAADETYTNTVVDRASRLLGNANKDNYKDVREQALRYAAARGVTLPYDLPEEYDEDAIHHARLAAIPTDKQENMEMLRDWRDSQIGYRRDVLTERAGYHQAVVGQGGRRIDETARHNKAQELLGTGRLEETGRHNQTTEGIQSDRVAETDRHNQVREGQQGRALDQYSTGERGNVRRPDPSTFRHRIVKGALQMQQLVKTTKHPEGEWINIR